VTHRSDRSTTATIRSDEAWRSLARRLAQTAAAIGDHVLAVLIVIAGTLAWSPRTGLAAARETVALRRDRRARLVEIARTQSPVWARQARRNALGWQRSAEAPRWRPDP
jgi:hypothetical protein